jgi:hypothetical protein
MSAELSVESDSQNYCMCSVVITNGFNCMMCSVNKPCYLLHPGLICYSTVTTYQDYMQSVLFDDSFGLCNKLIN